MSGELILCIPGPWEDQRDFLRQVVTLEPKGRYMFAGMILADVHARDHISLEFYAVDPQLPRAFEIAGQGKIPPEILRQIGQHSSVVYLLFPLDLPDQRERLLKFSQVVQRVGGIAVKVESSGVAHTWERWSTLLSGNPFDLYCAVVVLLGDEDVYYSCGMHHFGLPECALPRSVPIDKAAELMNQFNFWQIMERPKLGFGHTFSLSADSPHYRLTLVQDSRHSSDELFHNPHGIWHLDPA
jgi:hypothetical protein